jgi:hypothetical protein
MPTVQELESKRNETIGQSLIDLSQEVGGYARGNRTIDRAARTLKMVGGQLALGKINFSDAHAEVDIVYQALQENIKERIPYKADPSNPGSYGGVRFDFPEDFKAIAQKVYKMERELSTPRDKSVSKLYKPGSIGHGVLQAIASRGGCLSKELKAYWPVLNDASTLTHMRREGLIQKDGATTSPWQMTDLGKELLQERGPYDLNMWNKAKNGVNTAYYDKILPWEMPAKQHAEYVAEQCAARGRGYC